MPQYIQLFLYEIHLVSIHPFHPHYIHLVSISSPWAAQQFRLPPWGCWNWFYILHLTTTQFSRQSVAASRFWSVFVLALWLPRSAHCKVLTHTLFAKCCVWCWISHLTIFAPQTLQIPPQYLYFILSRGWNLRRWVVIEVFKYWRVRFLQFRTAFRQSYLILLTLLVPSQNLSLGLHKQLWSLVLLSRLEFETLWIN